VNIHPLCVLAVLVAGCASLPARDGAVETRLAEALERRGLGADALSVIGNLLAHGSPPPPMAPAAVLEALARPLAALDVAGQFERAVPASLRALERLPAPGSFEAALRTYIRELAQAQRLLREDAPGFDDGPLLRELAEGLPSAARLLEAGRGSERASRLFVDATARFASRARKVPLEPRAFDSPIGKVVIGTTGSDRHGPEAALIVDPGGDDLYERRPARAGAVSVIVDLDGNDQYRGSDVAVRALSAIVDLAGDDRYAMDGAGLGAAIAGASLLIDFSGNDTYVAKFFAQGAAAAGFGALVDLDGDDRYRVEAWGQGFAIAGATGLLWDRRGSDRYLAAGVPDPFERGAGMSGTGLSGAQGAGFGARGRLGGGTGILRDDAGDDVYQAQMFAQGIGYYYGLGLLWDLDGADRYEAYRYAQGNAAHQAVGVLRDERGDDRYAADWYAQGMGLDMAVGVLADGRGSDSFAARGLSQGTATANGFGLLVASNEPNRFSMGTETPSWGRAEWLRGLPSVGALLHGAAAQFTLAGKPVAAPAGNPPVAVQPAAPMHCPSPDPGEALLCRARDAPDLEGFWSEMKALLLAEPQTPLAGWVALALATRPPADAEAIARLLARRESCNVRALALRAWPTLAAANDAIRSSCFRLQAAAAAAFSRLGAPLPPDAALPSFLRALPPQEDTN